MTELQDPAHLNDVQRYKQLKSIFQGNNKLKNRNWFAHPTEMPLQLHLINRGAGANSLECYVFDASANEWQNYPSQPVATLSSKHRLEELINKILEDSGNQKDNGLGVIFHSDSDLATTEIPLDSGLPKDLEKLKQELIFNPTQILEDESLAASEYVWRMVPYLTAQSPPFATALVMSRQFDTIAENLILIGQEKDFPVRVTVLSSPLTTIQALPSLFSPTEGKAAAFLIPFEGLTVFGVLTPDGELRLVRSLQGRTNPSLVIHSIRTTMLSLELSDFDVYSIFTDRPNQMLQRALGKNFSSSETVSVNANELLAENIRGKIPFIVAAATRQLPLQATRLVENQTFKLLNKRPWGLANFCDPAARIVGFEPTVEEIKLARLGAKLRPLFAVSTVLIVIACGAWIFLSMTSDTWNFKPTEVNETKAKLAELKKANLKHAELETLLKDRSRAWSNLEFIARIIPADSGVYASQVDYSVTPTRQTSGGTAFSRSWKISGYYDDTRAGDLIAKLGSREYIQKVFEEVSLATGDQSFGLKKTGRTLREPRLSESENQRVTGSPRSNRIVVNPASLPRKFQLEIEQEFSPGDPLALPYKTEVKKKKKKKKKK